MKYSLKLIICFIFFAFGILFSWWITTEPVQMNLIKSYNFLPYQCLNEFNNTCSPYLEDNCICKAGPTGEEPTTVLITILLLVPLGYSIIFSLFLISRYHVKTEITNVIMKIPREKIEEIIEPAKNGKKSIFQFIVLSSIITILTVLALLNFATSAMIARFTNLMGTMDVTGIVSNFTKNLDFPDVASEELVFNVGIISFIFFGIGPFWLILLKQIRKFRKQNNENKNPYSGSKSLLLYLYTIFVLLIISHSEKSIFHFKIYGYTAPSDEINLLFIVGISFIVSFISYLIQRFVIQKFETPSSTS